MQLILLESVDGLGRPGDQVRVKSGYARNFLLPRGKAVPVSADALRSLGKLKLKAEAEERAMISSMQELGQKIAGAAVSIQARATEEGHLFGSVGDKDIQAALVAAGWEVPARAVRLAAPFKEAGAYEVDLHLHGTITASVSVTVVPINAEGNVIEVVKAEAVAETPSDEEAEAESGDEAPAAG